MPIYDNGYKSCPTCMSLKNSDAWKVINAVSVASEKESLMEGTLFKVRCPECGKMIKADFPVLYENLEKKFSVQYLTSLHTTKVVAGS